MICDVLIVGGGVIGLSIARELARNSLSITLLDRQEPGREASWAGAGILPPASLGGPQDPLTSLTSATHRLWPGLSAELLESTGIDNGFRRCGGVRLSLPDESSPELTFRPAPLRSLDDELNAWRDAGANAELLQRHDLRRIEPALAESFDRAVYLPELCQVRNPRHLQALLTDCHRLGVVIRPDVEVLSLDADEQVVRGVVTAQGAIPAGQVVLAAGAWTSTLLPPGVPAVTIEPVRGQMVLFRQRETRLRHVLECGSRYIVPRDDGRVLVGSTEERAGFTKRTTPEGIDSLLAFASCLVPELREATQERSWAGLRPHAVAGVPWIGAVPECKGLFVAAGHFRSGLHLSPITAQMICDEILSTRRNVAVM